MSVSRSDLDWWWDLARKVEWTFAKTYADSAPHWYVVLGRTRGLSRDDFVKVAELVRTYGEPGKFYSKAGLYLYNPERTHKIWTMDEHVEDTDLINLAYASPTYGPQTFTVADLARINQLRLPATDDQHPDSGLRRSPRLQIPARSSPKPSMVEMRTSRTAQVGQTDTPCRESGACHVDSHEVPRPRKC